MNTVLSMATASLLSASRVAAAVPGVPTDASWPRTMTDAMGRKVFIPAPPQRIVTVFPSNVEILFALGLASRAAAAVSR